MKSFLFTLLTIVFFLALMAGGYFAIKGLKSPASYIQSSNERIGDIHPLTTDPETAITGTSIASLGTPVTNTVATGVTASSVATTATGATTTSANATLASNIAALAKKGTTVKLGAKGVSVGYIEQFVNLYFKKNMKIDNVFSKSLQGNIITFQKQNKLSQTGSVGTATWQMMGMWLAKNS